MGVYIIGNAIQEAFIDSLQLDRIYSQGADTEITLKCRCNLSLHKQYITHKNLGMVFIRAVRITG